MSWYRDDDGKIITDEEFYDDCCECSAFCQEGTISVPCNGERTDCPYFKEVDTSDYDKEIRNKAIDEFLKKICEKYTEEESKGNYKQYCCNIKQELADIAEQMKGGAE